jgi:hypothetical protein
MRRLRTPRLLLLAIVMSTVACGESPLESIGLRSSDWINEPTVPTTVAVNTTTPTVVGVEQLQWVNDDIETPNADDTDLVLAQVFARRQGDRFIQASRLEIAVALPDVAFPARAPAGAEWVSSQLVFDNDGGVADSPSAAFGVWSAEPYTRSRSVAQMIVFTVSTDPEAASELASGEVTPSCARFAERTTEQCEVISVGARDIWLLSATSGSTLIWFEGTYRYELFGRSFVPLAILRDMTDGMVPVASIGAAES